MIRDYGGSFVADVVGLGKSYIGTAIVKHFERTDHARPLIICPAPLVEMWERYNEVYELNARRVLSMGYLREEEDGGMSLLMKDVKFKDRDFVLIDESHNLRHPDTQRYRVVQEYLATCRRCCFPDGHAPEQDRLGCLPSNQALSPGRQDRPSGRPARPEGVFQAHREDGTKVARPAGQYPDPADTQPHLALVRFRRRNATTG